MKLPKLPAVLLARPSRVAQWLLKQKQLVSLQQRRLQQLDSPLQRKREVAHRMLSMQQEWRPSKRLQMVTTPRWQQPLATQRMRLLALASRSRLHTPLARSRQRLWTQTQALMLQKQLGLRLRQPKIWGILMKQSRPLVMQQPERSKAVQVAQKQQTRAHPQQLQQR